MQSRSLLDEALEDFPKSEIRRIQTDGCQAKNFLADLNKTDIKLKTLKTQICNFLNSDPLIAMAQINELFCKIKSEELIVPKGYHSSSPSGLIHFFKSNDSEITTAHQNISREFKPRGY